MLAFFSPTGCVCPASCRSYHAYSPKPAFFVPEEYHVVVLPARHAYSHSASVGKRYVRPAACSSGNADNLSQNRTASSQLTFSTGCWAPLKWLGFVPITALILCLCHLVDTQIERLGNPHPVLLLITCPSFFRRGEPIMNSPAGISTSFIPIELVIYHRQSHFSAAACCSGDTCGCGLPVARSRLFLWLPAVR